MNSQNKPVEAGDVSDDGNAGVRQVTNKQTYAVYDQCTYREQFWSDLQSAQDEILIQSPYITLRGVERLAPVIKDAIARGVKTCVFVQQPKDWAARDEQHVPAEVKARMDAFQSAVDLLSILPVHVNLRDRIHEKLAVIDGRVLWDGSLNILSHYDTSERLGRWLDRNQANDAIVRHRLDGCSQCSPRDPWSSFSDAQAERRMRRFGDLVATRRRGLRLSQRLLAEQAQTAANAISQLEAGKRNMSLHGIIRVLGAMGLELMAVPRVLLPAVEQLVNGRCLLEDQRASIARDIKWTRDMAASSAVASAKDIDCIQAKVQAEPVPPCAKERSANTQPPDQCP